jgi:hypothetical protein
MNFRKLLGFLPALAPLAVAAAAPFGQFGSTLDAAKQTQFFTWFHMVQTEVDGGAATFQPSGPRFHDLVKLRVNTMAGEIRSMTLAVRRSFIDGRDSVFARDISKSFLEMTDSDAFRSLIKEVWESRSDRGRKDLPEEPSAAYRVFLGEEAAWSGTFGPGSKIDVKNDGEWLLIGVSR